MIHMYIKISLGLNHMENEVLDRTGNRFGVSLASL